MMKLNESVSDGSIIQLEIVERDINISYYNAIYIYNHIMELPKNLMQKKLVSVVRRDTNFNKIIKESRTGQMT